MHEIIIGIFDVVPADAGHLKTIVFNYLLQSKNKAKLIIFSGEKEVIERKDMLDILFLDIDMHGIDSIEIGRRIRKRNKRCKIIVAANQGDRIKEAFLIGAFRYVSKPFSPPEIEEALNTSLKTFIGMDEIKLYENRRAHNIQQMEILFVTAYDGYVEVIVKNRKLRRDISLTRMEELLDQRLFCRVNRESLVNLHLIDNYQDGIIDIGNCRIKVARRKRKAFENLLRQFDAEYRKDCCFSIC